MTNGELNLALWSSLGRIGGVTFYIQDVFVTPRLNSTYKLNPTGSDIVIVEKQILSCKVSIEL